MAAVNSRETPQMELSGVAQLPVNTNCMACSGDGRYLALGHSQGLSVWCASSFTRVAERLQDRLEITLVQMTRMTEGMYLLGTVDNMGVARVFALYSNDIHLLSVINVMKDISQRSICLTFELYEGGCYGAASFSCNGAAWLEVLQFPLAEWLKELENATSQKQPQDRNVSEEMGVKWSPVTLMSKITPSEPPPGRTGDNALNFKSDFFTHCLALDVIRGGSHQRGKLSSSADAGQTKETRGSSRTCTSHFLLPCGRCFGGSKADFQSDMAPTPEVLWPNANEIVCSSVSRCTQYIGLGLEDAVVCIWDRRTGAPLKIASVPSENRENSALLRMEVETNWTASVHKPQVFTAEPVQVLALCKNGAIYTINTRQWAESCFVQLTERPKDSRDLPTIIMSVSFLRGVILVVQRNGKMFLQDVINKTTVCSLTPPASHRIASPCSPVYALNAKQQVLFIRGDHKTSCSDPSNTKTQLFVFRLEQSEIIRPYVVPQPDSSQQQPTLCCHTQEETCNLYLQQRLLSVDERKKTFEQTWKRLQETAATMQQSPQGHEHLN